MGGQMYQFHATAAASCGSLAMGLLNAWPSYTTDLYTDKNTTLLSAPMTDVQSSLLGSLPSLGAMVGTAVAGPIIDKIGRKMGGVVCALPIALSWAIISATSSIFVILAARFLGGVAGGAFLVFGPMFISEVAEDSIRGLLASGPVSFYCFGTLISYCMGWFLHYNIIIWINLAVGVLCVFLTFTVVESPLFLMRQNREEDARAAIAHYRGSTPVAKIVLQELTKLKAKITPPVELVAITDDSKEKKADDEHENLEPEKEKLNTYSYAAPEEQKPISSFKLLFVSPSSRRAFIVVGTALTLQVFMGMVPVQVYAKNLFAQAAPNLSSHFCSVLFAFVLVAGCAVPALVADKAGRRFLIISSSVMVSLCMATLGFLLQTGLAPPIVSAVVILLYCFFFSFGAGTIPYVLLAEVFVPEVQGAASMILVEWAWFTNFVIIAIFPPLTKLLGTHSIFYGFAAVSIVNAVISFFNVPETKGLSNEQIQEAFLRRRK